MTTKNTGGSDPQDVLERTLRSKRKKADELVRDVALEQSTGIPFFLESAWLKMVEIGKNDEVFLDMVIEFCQLMIWVSDADKYHLEYPLEEYLEQTATLAQMQLNIVMECLRMHKKDGDWIVDLIE